MAKKKREFKIEQSVDIIGVVFNAQLKEIGANKLEMVEIGIKTPEGVIVNVSKFTKETGSEYVNGKIAEMVALVDRVTEGEKIYVRKNIYSTEDKGQFDWLTSYETDEGKSYFKATGFLDELDWKETDEGDLISWTKFGNATSKLFTDIQNEITVTMYAKDKDENKVFLSDLKEDYPNELAISVDNTDGVEEGVAYKLKLKFVKGAMIEAEKAIEVELDWGATEEKGKYEFEDDKLVPFSVVKTTLIGDGFVGDGGNELPF